MGEQDRARGVGRDQGHPSRDRPARPSAIDGVDRQDGLTGHSSDRRGGAEQRLGGRSTHENLNAFSAVHTAVLGAKRGGEAGGPDTTGHARYKRCVWGLGKDIC
ncbi:hypothetical protein GCM10010472_19150 [Pseudonocardia halophobica]|uniref:Uncharacterized protein n=1 Tax=Pseudonocardia halophobica TaxID=29401 RepID=A0A9W6KXL8_9PSEU|nr:hypothetical protein GCM10017577_10110 [Pseudonocardia halophobica]